MSISLSETFNQYIATDEVPWGSWVFGAIKKISHFSEVVDTGQRPSVNLNVLHKKWWRDHLSLEVFFVFICLGFFVPLENFSLIWRLHHYRLRTANFDQCLALMAIEQWVFFSMPHLLWHGASVYNGHLREPVTHTYCRAFSSGAVTNKGDH